MVDLSFKNIFQWAFALSPFPSYLPQYFAMMQQLNVSEEPVDNGSISNVSIDRGADYSARKRVAISPGTGGLLVTGTPSKTQPSDMDEQKEAGMSPATIFILLAAHLMRMLYFHGLILEDKESHPLHNVVHTRALAGDELYSKTDKRTFSFADDESNNIHLLSLKPTAVARMISSMTDITYKKPPFQSDLFGQSCSMIIMQVMLLHTMMRLRRRRLSKRSKCKSSELPDSNNTLQIPHLSPYNGPSNNAHHILDTLSLQPFWQRQFEKIMRAIKSHVLHLVSPSNILKDHTFFQYMELVCLSSMVVKLMFDYQLHPKYGMVIVQWLKHTSIVLESCLALPQAMKNYKGRTTEGLSLVMVLGWIFGDFFKLCYFLLGMISPHDGLQTAKHDGNDAFAMGCMLALMADWVVVTQMLYWYPTADVVQLRERISQSIRHWRANKDDDAGKSLLIKNQGKGLFASAVHLFYALFRRKPFSTSSQSIDS